MSDAAELWLVRHGQTEWSENGRHTSVTDLPLTPQGEEQARSLAPLLGDEVFDHVLTSPRLRARHSAELAGYPEAEVDADLVEWAYGEHEGLTTPQIRRTVPGWTVWSHPSPGGETPDEVAARLDRVVARARAAGGRTLVFGHGHALRALAARWVGLGASDGRIFVLDTATVSVLGDDRGQPVVERWNDASAR